MSSALSRRNILKLAGGSALGFLLSPMPWKMLDDISIWTQNWSWIPKLRRGPVTHKYTSCTLCPNACRVNARMISETPVSLWGAPDPCVGHSYLCSVGLAGHHLAYHPSRVRNAHRFTATENGISSEQLSVEDAIAHIAKILHNIHVRPEEGEFALFDCRPHGMVSDIQQIFLSHVPGARYIVPDNHEGRFMRALMEMTEDPGQSYGLDFSRTRTLLSFGVSLFEGWGISPLVVEQFRSRREEFNIIQIDHHQSSSSIVADTHIAIKPGTEMALALGLAHVIVGERLYDPASAARAVDLKRNKPFSFMDLTRRFPPGRVASVTGIPEDVIVRTAREFASNRPATAIADDFAPAELIHSVWILNHLVGATGKNGSVVQKRPLPQPWKGAHRTPPTRLRNVPDHSLRLLMIDASAADTTVSWPDLRRKMRAENATIVLCSPYRPKRGESVDYLIPIHAPYETVRANPSGEYVATSAFQISTPLWSKSEEGCETWQILQRVVSASDAMTKEEFAQLEPEELLRLQCDAIFNSKRGTIHHPNNDETIPLGSVLSSGDFYATLMEGAAWSDDGVATSTNGRLFLMGKSTSSAQRFAESVLAFDNAGIDSNPSFPLLVVPVGEDVAARFGHVSPILSKIYQESDLKPRSRFAYLHHETARRFKLAAEQRVIIHSPHGATEAIVRCDSSVRPDTVQLSVSQLDAISPTRPRIINSYGGRVYTDQPIFVRIERARS